MTLDDAAAYMSVKPTTIRDWIDEGRLPAYRVGPRLIRIYVNDLDAMLTPVEVTTAVRHE